MKLSRASGYAVCALVYLARKGPGGPVTSEAIARAEGLPERFLLKLLVALVRAGTLSATKGPHGGYRLAKPARDVSLLEIVEAVDGPVRGDVPPVDNDGEAGIDHKLQTACDGAADIVRRNLARVSVAELAGKRK
jgi:Rrf2 family protein